MEHVSAQPNVYWTLSALSKVQEPLCSCSMQCTYIGSVEPLGRRPASCNFRVFPALWRSSAARANHRSASLSSRTVSGLSGKTENKWPLNLISILRGRVMFHSGPRSPDTGPLSACYTTNCRSFVLASYFSGPLTYYKLIFSDCRRAPTLIIQLKVFILTTMFFYQTHCQSTLVSPKHSLLFYLFIYKVSEQIITAYTLYGTDILKYIKKNKSNTNTISQVSKQHASISPHISYLLLCSHTVRGTVNPEPIPGTPRMGCAVHTFTHNQGQFSVVDPPTGIFSGGDPKTHADAS